MNEYTILTSVKSELIAQTWTGSANVVFPTGCVAITPPTGEVVRNALETMRVPFALIQPSSAESDPNFDEEPDFMRILVNIIIVVAIPGGAVGEEAMLGANKTLGSTKSEGRGLLEIEQEVYNAIGKLNALESITLQFRQRGEEGAIMQPPSTWIQYRTLSFEGWCTTV